LARIRRRTSAPSARPFASRITAPTIGPIACCFPPRTCSTAPGFEREGKRYLTVAVGCTGGKHRSVAIAEELAARLQGLRLVASAQHRDLGRE